LIGVEASTENRHRAGWQRGTLRVSVEGPIAAVKRGAAERAVRSDDHGIVAGREAFKIVAWRVHQYGIGSQKRGVWLARSDGGEPIMNDQAAAVKNPRLNRREAREQSRGKGTAIVLFNHEQIEARQIVAADVGDQEWRETGA